MRTFRLAIVALLLFTFALINQQIGKELQIKRQHETYQVCLLAHNEINGASEQACADAQEATNTEFVCDYNGQHCWLEVK